MLNVAKILCLVARLKESTYEKIINTFERYSTFVVFHKSMSGQNFIQEDEKYNINISLAKNIFELILRAFP